MTDSAVRGGQRRLGSMTQQRAIRTTGLSGAHDRIIQYLFLVFGGHVVLTVKGTHLGLDFRPITAIILGK